MDLMSSRVILCLATRKNTDYVLVSFYRLNYYTTEWKERIVCINQEGLCAS